MGRFLLFGGGAGHFYEDLARLNLLSGLRLCLDAGAVASYPSNHMIRTEAFDNASWVKAEVTVTADAATAPDGATTADKIIPSAVSGGHQIYQTRTLTANTKFVLSFYLKFGEYQRARVTVWNGTDGYVARADFDLSTGAILQTLNGTAKIEAAGQGFFRCSVTGTPTVANSNCYIECLDNTSATSFAGNGSDGIYAWGAQVEPKRLGRYIPVDSGSSAGKQKWLDLTAGEYDFFLGADATATTNDPTFNGTFGALTSGEYFSVDGGDFLRYDTTSESWMNAMHQDAALFTILAWIYLPAAGTAAGIVGNVSTAAGTGINFEYLASGKLGFDVANAGNANVLATKTADATTTASAWHLVGVTIDEATGAGGGFLYEDGAYKQVASANTFDATYTTPSAGAASHALELFAKGNATGPMANGGRIAGAMIWQGVALTKAQMDLVWHRQRGRFGV